MDQTFQNPQRFDATTLLISIGGQSPSSVRRAREMTQDFVEDLPELLLVVQQSALEARFDDLERSLKGFQRTAAQLGLIEASRKASQIRELAALGQFSQELFQELQKEAQRGARLLIGFTQKVLKTPS